MSIEFGVLYRGMGVRDLSVGLDVEGLLLRW